MSSSPNVLVENSWNPQGKLKGYRWYFAASNAVFASGIDMEAGWIFQYARLDVLNCKSIYPLEICYIAIENGSVKIVSFPIEHGDFLELCSISRESIHLKMANFVSCMFFGSWSISILFKKIAQVHVSCPCKADLHCGPWSVWGTFWIQIPSNLQPVVPTFDSGQLVYKLR